MMMITRLPKLKQKGGLSVTMLFRSEVIRFAFHRTAKEIYAYNVDFSSP